MQHELQRAGCCQERSDIMEKYRSRVKHREQMAKIVRR
jgi:hypothetical protein